MCEPTTWVLVAGMVVTAAAGAYSADASKKAGQAQVIMADRNAKLEDYKADVANRIGAVQEENHRAKVRQMVGTQRATLAANGVDITSGTAAELMDQTVAFGETDAQTIRYNAAREAWGFGVNADNYRTQSAVTKAKTHNEVTGTYISTAGSLLTQGYGGYTSGAFSGGGGFQGV